MNTIAVYRSRSDALKVLNYLTKQRLACTTINTPSYLNLGCGLSVLFNEGYVQEIRKANKKIGLKSFVGFYSR